MTSTTYIKVLIRKKSSTPGKSILHRQRDEMGLTPYLIDNVLCREGLCPAKELMWNAAWALHVHEDDDMHNKHDGHRPRPPAVLVDSAVVAPGADRPCGPLSRSF